MVPKFQMGGVVNPLSVLKPITLETAPDKSQSRPSMSSAPRRSPISSSKRKPAQGTDTDMKGVLESDRLYIKDQENALIAKMQQVSLTDPNYYQNGGATLHQSQAQQIGEYKATALPKANQFKMLQKKYTTSNDEIASDGNDVLVMDAQGNYSIIPYSKAVTAKDDSGRPLYKTQTVGTALNLRMSDKAFSGFTENGKEIEKLISNTVDSTSFNKLMRDSFKSVGSVAGDVFIDSVGNDIPMEELLNTIQTGQLTKSSSKPLANAVNNFTANLSAGELGHLRTQAWEAYRREHPETNNPTEWVENRMQEIIKGNALSYLKTSYKSSKGTDDAEAKAKAKEMAETMNVSSLDLAKMAPTGRNITLQLDSSYSDTFKELGGGEALTTFKTSVIDEDMTSVYNAQKIPDVPNDFRNNAMVNSLGVGYTLADGTPLTAIDDGEDQDDVHPITIVPNSKITILHDVPMKYDKKAGVWQLAGDYLSFYAMLQKQVTKEIEAATKAKRTSGASTEETIDWIDAHRDDLVHEAKLKVLANIKKNNKDKSKTHIDIPNPNDDIITKTVATMEILTNVSDDIEDHPYLKNFTPADKNIITSWQAKQYNAQTESSESSNDLGKALVFVPLNEYIGLTNKFFSSSTLRKKEIYGMLKKNVNRKYKLK